MNYTEQEMQALIDSIVKAVVAGGAQNDGEIPVGISNRHIHLTERGKATAEKIMSRHTVLTQMLVSLGVDPETASNDACKMEHVISDETFEAIKNHVEEHETNYNQ